MLNDLCQADFTNLFSPEVLKNDKKILQYFLVISECITVMESLYKLDNFCLKTNKSLFGVEV